MLTLKQKSIFFSLCFALFSVVVSAEPVEITRHQDEYSTARLKAVQFDGRPAIAVQFSGTDDLHYYADSQTAPAPELDLKAAGQAGGVDFGRTLFPEPQLFYEASLEKEIDVYVGDFYLVLPIESYPPQAERLVVEVHLSGIACTSQLCLPPFETTLSGEFNFSEANAWPVIDFTPAAMPEPVAPAVSHRAPLTQSQSAAEVTLMLLLALLAGLAFNVMPCVLPVLPLIVSRMVNISKEHPGRRIALGLTFCVGIAAFFVAVGVFSSALRLTTGAVFTLSDPYRYPIFNIVMVLFLVVFAMFMFDVLPLTLPSKISGKTADTSTFSGSFGMGFLAAILSIPCSGAILAAVLVWVQAQHWLMGFWAFLLMGVGMALPYGVLVAVPNLLSRVPKPGPWMDQFKKAMGFALLLLAVNPLSALPKDRIISVLSFAVFVAFAVWMWGSWVSFSTPSGKKWLVRGLAVLLVGVAGFGLLPQKEDIVDWADYDRNVIRNAVDQQQPVLIKFTADWCFNCKILEDRVFRDPEVARTLQDKNVLAVLADTTLADFPASVDLRDIYDIPGTVPMTVILLPDRADQPQYLSGIYSKQDLFEVLKELE